eukprot:scaffold203673_cov41-Attheya_sp.AAC.2
MSSLLLGELQIAQYFATDGTLGDIRYCRRLNLLFRVPPKFHTNTHGSYQILQARDFPRQGIPVNPIVRKGGLHIPK